MPMCCKQLHVGWVCPKCGSQIKIKPHSGNEPVPIGKLKSPVTIVKGDYIQGSIIKDSVVMGDVPSTDVGAEITAENVIQGNEIQDSIVVNDSLSIEELLVDEGI